MSDKKELWDKIKVILGGCSPVDPTLHPERAETIGLVYEKLRPLFEQNIEEPSVSDKDIIEHGGQKYEVIEIEPDYFNPEITHLAIRPVPKPLREEWVLFYSDGSRVNYDTREEALRFISSKVLPPELVHMREVPKGEE